MTIEMLTEHEFGKKIIIDKRVRGGQESTIGARMYDNGLQTCAYIIGRQAYVPRREAPNGTRLRLKLPVQVSSSYYIYYIYIYIYINSGTRTHTEAQHSHQT